MRLLFTIVIVSSLSFSTIAQTADQQVTMTTLNAVPRNNQVLISWNPEQNNIVSYHVERSKNGTDFVAFSQVEGTNGPFEFLETDFTPFNGLSYYRISATSTEGTILYSNIVPVKFSAEGNSASPLPSTATGNNTQKEKSILIIVRNKDGNEFYSKVEVENAGDPVQCKDPEPFLAKGTYTIVGCSEQELYSKQIIVN
ncbi:MAG: hypothetical protein M3R17_14855 [Bacteroidota bacterium]|nr:hypothetical protein [Bacteroidota bacterium]